MKKIAILASGSGSNAENIIRFFQHHPSVLVDSVWTNKSDAYVLERAERLNVEAHVFTRNEMVLTDQLLVEFKRREIDLIVLAGFLLLLPQKFVREFPCCEHTSCPSACIRRQRNVRSACTPGRDCQ